MGIIWGERRGRGSCPSSFFSAGSGHVFCLSNFYFIFWFRGWSGLLPPPPPVWTPFSDSETNPDFCPPSLNSQVTPIDNNNQNTDMYSDLHNSNQVFINYVKQKLKRVYLSQQTNDVIPRKICISKEFVNFWLQIGSFDCLQLFACLQIGCFDCLRLFQCLQICSFDCLQMSTKLVAYLSLLKAYRMIF